MKFSSHTHQFTTIFHFPKKNKSKKIKETLRKVADILQANPAKKKKKNIKLKKYTLTSNHYRDNFFIFLKYLEIIK